MFAVRTVLFPDGAVAANPTALPEAFVAYGWRSSGGLRESVQLVEDGTARALRDTPVVETAAASPSSPAAATPARRVTRTDTTVTIEADAPRPGRLVLLDTFYPGWQATVDGRRVPIAATNAAFRSVPVPAGRHEVRFEYRPASVRWGAVISIAALLLLGAAIVLGGGRRRQ